MSKRICAALVAAAFVFAGCAGGQKGGTEAPESTLTGAVAIDGSSTVYPVTEAVAEEFQKENAGVKVTVGISGTGGGFKKFCRGETDISDASRPIKPEEAAECKTNNIEYTELKVAIDGLSVLVNPSNSFVDCMTKAELNAAWKSGSTVKTWKDIRAEWPAEPIKFYGAGSDSGTFDYFTEAINGKDKDIRADYTASEDDNTLVTGIGNDKNALGFFGYAYYAENKDKLKLVGVDNGEGCVKPSQETIVAGKYKPLSRPIFIYAKHTALTRPEVEAFTNYYLDNVNDLLADIGYIPLPKTDFAASEAALAKALQSAPEASATP